MADREKVIEGLKYCTQVFSIGSCAGCPYADVGDTFSQCGVALMFDCLDLLKAQEQFMQWLARLVTHDDGDGAECEIICRRLREMGYVEKYEENEIEYWRAMKRNEL